MCLLQHGLKAAHSFDACEERGLCSCSQKPFSCQKTWDLCRAGLWMYVWGAAERKAGKRGGKYTLKKKPAALLCTGWELLLTSFIWKNKQSSVIILSFIINKKKKERVSHNAKQRLSSANRRIKTWLQKPMRRYLFSPYWHLAFVLLAAKLIRSQHSKIVGKIFLKGKCGQ